MIWLFRAFVLIGTAVLVIALAVSINRVVPRPYAGTQQTPVSSPRSDCIAFANETTAKNPEAVWKSVYNGCASNYSGPEAKGDSLDLGPKAVRTVPIPAPIGTRPVPSR